MANDIPQVLEWLELVQRGPSEGGHGQGLGEVYLTGADYGKSEILVKNALLGKLTQTGRGHARHSGLGRGGHRKSMKKETK